MQNALKKMREAREADSVLKLRLLKLRSAAKESNIFVFEGPDDRAVYSRWIMRANPTASYEPFVCNGKREARKLSKILDRDVSGLTNVYIFVDRDFDDLEYFQYLDAVFVTDRYSIENYMIDEQVLERILRDDVGVAINPALRAKIMTTFCSDINAFCSSATSINFRIFIEKRCRIRRHCDPDESVSNFVEIQLGSVVPKSVCVYDFHRLDWEPNPATAKILWNEFSDFDPRCRYRGKFIWNFFKKWVDLLIKDLRSGASIFLTDSSKIEGLKGVTPSLVALSSHSPMPEGLQAFLART